MSNESNFISLNKLIDQIILNKQYLSRAYQLKRLLVHVWMNIFFHTLLINVALMTILFSENIL